MPKSQRKLMRVDLQLVPGALARPHVLLLTLGGPIYCAQIAKLARSLDALLLCPDFGPNRYERVGERAQRKEDWGDPAYLNDVARLPDRLRRDGIGISRIVVIGASYAGFSNSELVATHPSLHPAALIVVDSFFDLPARFRALRRGQPTRREMEAVIGGTPAQRPRSYQLRSPSHHLEGVVDAIQTGMRFIDVWSLNRQAIVEFNGAPCSRSADAEPLSRLAQLLGHPITGYVTELRHGHALWQYGTDLLTLAGVEHTHAIALPARKVIFRPGKPPPPDSYCPLPSTRALAP